MKLKVTAPTRAGPHAEGALPTRTHGIRPQGDSGVLPCAQMHADVLVEGLTHGSQRRNLKKNLKGRDFRAREVQGLSLSKLASKKMLLSSPWSRLTFLTLVQYKYQVLPRIEDKEASNKVTTNSWPVFKQL